MSDQSQTNFHDDLEVEFLNIGVFEEVVKKRQLLLNDQINEITEKQIKLEAQFVLNEKLLRSLRSDSSVTARNLLAGGDL